MLTLSEKAALFELLASGTYTIAKLLRPDAPSEEQYELMLEIDASLAEVFAHE